MACRVNNVINQKAARQQARSKLSGGEGDRNRDRDTEGNAHADKEGAGGLQCGRMQVTHIAINTHIGGEKGEVERQRERHVKYVCVCATGI